MPERRGAAAADCGRGGHDRGAHRPEKAQSLNEFVAVTGFHRKHAMRLLRAQAAPEDSAKARPKRRIYDETVSATLVILWEASDRVCGKRLKALSQSCSAQWNDTPTFSSKRSHANCCSRVSGALGCGLKLQQRTS